MKKSRQHIIIERECKQMDGSSKNNLNEVLETKTTNRNEECLLWVYQQTGHSQGKNQ